VNYKDKVQTDTVGYLSQKLKQTVIFRICNDMFPDIAVCSCFCVVIDGFFLVFL